MDKNSNENSEKNIKYEDIFDPDDHVRIKWIMELASYQRMDDSCLLYTSDAADDLLCVDLGGRRIIKKKKTTNYIINIMKQHN